MQGYLNTERHVLFRDNNLYLAKHIPEQSQIAIGIARNQHVLRGRSATGRNDGRCGGIVAIAPDARDHEADRTEVRQPFDVLHGDRTAFGRQRFHVP